MEKVTVGALLARIAKMPIHLRDLQEVRDVVVKLPKNQNETATISSQFAVEMVCAKYMPFST